MKSLKIILAAAAAALIVNLSFADAGKLGVPKGWTAIGPTDGDKYEVGLDPSQGQAGHPALYIASKEMPSTDMAALTQTIDAQQWHGQVVTLSMEARAVGEKNNIWLRSSMGSFLVTADRYKEQMAYSVYTVSSSDWQPVSVEITVPESTVVLNYGLALTGPGKLWVRNIKLSKRPALISYCCDHPLYHVPLGVVSDAPRNLDFSE